LRSLAGDAAYIASRVEQIEGPVLLVAHSYGGAVITGAGAKAGNVVGLVYIAAFAPDEDESLFDINGRFAARTEAEKRCAAAIVQLLVARFAHALG
jgi:predicted alpha/beta hydrolase family esterase